VADGGQARADLVGGRRNTAMYQYVFAVSLRDFVGFTMAFMYSYQNNFESLMCHSAILRVDRW